MSNSAGLDGNRVVQQGFGGETIADLEPSIQASRGKAPPPSSPAERLMKIRIERGYPTMEAAAAAIGVAKASYWRHETGVRTLSATAAEQYGGHFGVPATYLLFGGSSVEVPIVGIIGAGGRVLRLNEDKPVQTVPSPDSNARGNWTALRVTAMDMWCLGIGDIVFFDQTSYDAPINRRLVNRKLCIVGIQNGMPVQKLRFVTMQNDGRAALASYAGPSEPDVAIRFAAPVLHITLAAAIEHSKHDGAG